jgi:hypothetical protein
MNDVRRRVVAVMGALALGGGLILAATSNATAGTTPGWEPDAQAIGTITFYNSSGTVITGGSLDASPFAAYAVASHAGRSGDTQAQLYADTPQQGANPQTWSGDLLSASGYKPVPAGTPADVSSSGKPFVKGFSGDLTFNDYIGEFPNNLTATGYQNLYEMRIYTAGALPADTTVYDRVDIQVDTVAGTWQVVYPAPVSPPTVKSAAKISGAVRLGSTVSCVAAFNGATSTTYSWLVNNAAAKSATKKTFAIPAADFGKKLSCKATGTNGGGSLSSTSPQSVVKAGGPLHKVKAPVLFSKHKHNAAVKGTFEFVRHGTWSPAATKYHYQWYVNGKAIKHATASKYKIPGADVGKKLSCKVTASRTHWASGSAKTSSVKVKK